MRQSLKKLFEEALILKYELPHTCCERTIPRTIITKSKDRCLEQIGKNSDIASLIYNGIVEYAYNDNEIDFTQLDKLQARALQSKIKYNPNADLPNQLGYGFHGEVMLHLILDLFFHGKKCIARGYMFSALANAEIKGYDSYMMTEIRDRIYLLFGEAKFHLSGYKESLKSIFENIDHAFSDSYFNRNFIVFDNLYEKLASESRIPAIIDEWRAAPCINIAECAREHKMHLVYPMLILFDKKNKEYDELILEVVNHIEATHKAISSDLSLPFSLFFIFLPLGNSREIKTQVLEWIKRQQPLMP
jgi:hypothetical protein